MQKRRALIVLALCFAAPVQAGLFSDDDARKSIQQVEARVLVLEEQDQLQIKSTLDLQGQIELLNGELRKLRGQNEELAHGLQEADKREKDFYVDLDTRLRHFESKEVAPEVVAAANAAAAADPDNPSNENRAIELAYGLLKAAKYAEAVKALQGFMSKYPASVHINNATFWLGNAQFGQQDYKNALLTFRDVLKAAPDYSRAPDVLLNTAACQRSLKAVLQASATLKQLISKYPDSEAAAKAKNLLAAVK